MANIRELGRKVNSLRNMQKVMRAMNMIASTKLRKIIGRYPSLCSFEAGAIEMARNVALAYRDSNHPLISRADEVQNGCVVLFTSDKGLCGSHNNSVQRAAASLIEGQRQHGVTMDVVCIGNRGASFCRRNDFDIFLSTESNDRTLTDDALREIAGKLMSRMLAGEIQEVHFVFNSFVSALQQVTRTAPILPLCTLLPEELPATMPEFAVEPAGESFLPVAASNVLFFLLQSALRHSHLSEHASRMTAMDNATNNSEDLISRYGAIRNRARQTAITNELIEIVAGKEALKD